MTIEERAEKIAKDVTAEADDILERRGMDEESWDIWESEIAQRIAAQIAQAVEEAKNEGMTIGACVRSQVAERELKRAKQEGFSEAQERAAGVCDPECPPTQMCIHNHFVSIADRIRALSPKEGV